MLEDSDVHKNEVAVYRRRVFLTTVARQLKVSAVVVVLLPVLWVSAMAGGATRASIMGLLFHWSIVWLLVTVVPVLLAWRHSTRAARQYEADLRTPTRQPSHSP